MRKVIRVDNDGYFIEDVILEDSEPIPGDCIPEICPEGFYKPRWFENGWIEGLTQAEIDTIKNTPQPKSEAEKMLERLDATENALLYFINGGSI